jgi:hypothetical protein
MLNVASDAIFMRQQATAVVQALGGQEPVAPRDTHGYA